MAISEAARHDLYTGLRDVIGPERAETLMSAIPLHDLEEVVTKTDLRAETAGLRAEIAELRSDLRFEIAELRTETRSGLASLEAKLEAQQAAPYRHQTDCWSQSWYQSSAAFLQPASSSESSLDV